VDRDLGLDLFDELAEGPSSLYPPHGTSAFLSCFMHSCLPAWRRVNSPPPLREYERRHADRHEDREGEHPLKDRRPFMRSLKCSLWLSV
jgi:hypothetical protein